MPKCPVEMGASSLNSFRVRLLEAHVRGFGRVECSERDPEAKNGHADENVYDALAIHDQNQTLCATAESRTTEAKEKTRTVTAEKAFLANGKP
jgi:hypothetical protein